jgi:hypothetical protein
MTGIQYNAFLFLSLRKFFNALVSPDEESPARIMQVIHDKRTMRKLLQVVRLLNKDLGNVLDHVLTQGKDVTSHFIAIGFAKTITCLTIRAVVSLCSLEGSRNL